MKRVIYVLSCLIFIFSLARVEPTYAESIHELGIATNASLIGVSATDLDTRLRNIKNLGADWIRVDFSWYFIQPNSADKYNWTQHDRIVRAAQKYNLKVLGLLSYTPKWAREPRCNALAKNETAARKCAPKNINEFGRFAVAAAYRYKNKNVRGWEIWNEQNITAYWKTVQPDGTLFVDPKAYARLANMAATQMRYNTDVAIITGGLAPLFEPQPQTGMRQSDYLKEVLRYLNPDLFDGIGIHPYTWPILPDRAVEYNAFHTIDGGDPEYNLRTIMTQAGWSNKQIWATEFGASTLGVRSDSHPSADNRPDHVSEYTQALIVKEGIEGWQSKSNIGPLFVHSDSDRWLRGQKNESGFGLERSDGTKKPAYDAFKSAAERLEERF